MEGLDLEATPFDDLSAYDIHSIALSNLFGSAKDVAVNTAKALVDPKTYKAIAQLGGEAARKAAYYSRRSIEGYDALASAETAQGAPETPLLDTMTDFYAKTYNIGSEEGRRNLVRYYALDPASILADIAPVVGGAAAVAAKVTRAGSAANKVLGAVRKTARLADATNYPFLVARGLVPPVKWTANKAKDAGKRILYATPAPADFAAAEFCRLPPHRSLQHVQTMCFLFDKSRVRSR